MKDELKTKLDQWIIKIGRETAEDRLKKAGVSQSMRQKLLAGTYPSNPKIEILEMVDEAMKTGA